MNDLTEEAVKSQKGFSLIEIMVTLVILAFGLLSLGIFNVSATNDNEIAQERTAAVHLAEQVLEDWQNSASDTLPSVSCTSGSVSLSAGSSSTCTPTYGIAIPFTITPTVSRATAPLPDGHGNVSTGNLTGTPTPYLKLVTVSWSHKGASYSVYLTHITRAL